ncbi:hypothetical protein BX600DRAFT_431079 [Xylariales sp. PMI_506]|nr:hypothetical protein BX600DRAFT_431079 [Xylariales sp. PMI_506]
MASSLQPRFVTDKRGLHRVVIPHLLRPLVRAYAFGYLYLVIPKILSQAVRLVTKSKSKGASLWRVLCEGIEPHQFPTFCAALVGGSTFLEVPLFAAFSKLALREPRRYSRFLASFVAGWISLRILQSRPPRSLSTETSNNSNTNAAAPPPPTGSETTKYVRTQDLSLFVFTRALDVVIGELWAQRRKRREATQHWNRLDSAISKLTDPSVFALSSAIIMFAWFYYPSKLPRAYRQWISSAAAVDSRLIEALQRCRSGDLRYGEETGQAPLLQSMAADYKWPLHWGDPVKSVPFPCEMVHMGCGPSCEYHALSRFYRSFKWTMATYLPLSLLLAARNRKLKSFKTILISSSRSSSFLAAFITLFYYGVCLARTRVGPHILGRDAASRTKIDAGLCVGSGCFLCGWSILLETPGRHKDLALFVAPRALGTLLPRQYSQDKQWLENLTFAFSTGVVFTCVLENQKRVRGMLGNVLGAVLRT